MSVNAENARAIALDLVIAQAISSYSSLDRNTDDDNGALTSGAAGRGELTTGFALRHRPEKGRPFNFFIYSNTALVSHDQAEYESWATEDIADCWRLIRHAVTGLQNDNQAAAMIAFALHTSPQAVTKYLRSELRKYVNDELPATPHTGTQPTLATMMLNFSVFKGTDYDETHTSRIHRIQEVLLFFGRGLKTFDDIADRVYVYENAVWA